MALFTIRVVVQTDPQLVALAQQQLQATNRVAAATELIAATLEKIQEQLETPPERIPTRAVFHVGTPQEE